MIMGLLLASLFALSACQKPQSAPTPKSNHLRQSTLSVAQQADQVWRQTQTVTQAASDKPERATAANTLGPWTTDRGRFYTSTAFDPTTFSASRKRLSQTGPLISVAQANATLKAMGAKVQLQSLADLVYLKQRGGTTFDQPIGLLIRGQHLYLLQMTRDQTSGAITTGAVYSRRFNYASRQVLSLDAITGTWATTEGDQALVRNGQIFTRQSQAYVRGNIQALAALPAKTLYTGMGFYLRQSQSVKASARLSRQSLIGGDLYDHLYLFLSATKMVRLDRAGATVFTRTSKATSGLVPAQVLTVFDLLDQQDPDSPVAYLLPHGANTWSAALTSSLDYATINYSGGTTAAESVSLTNGQLSIGHDQNHN